jgi:hypothetical protein
MGNAILYCCKCGEVLAAKAFETRKAFQIGTQACCKRCLPAVLSTLPPDQAAALLSAASAPPPAVPEATPRSPMPRTPSGDTGRYRSSGKGGSSAALGLGLGGAAVLVVAGLFLGTSKPPNRAAPVPEPRATVPAPPPAPAVSAADLDEERAQALLSQAAAMERGGPENEEPRRALLARIVREYPKTSSATRAADQLSRPAAAPSAVLPPPPPVAPAPAVPPPPPLPAAPVLPTAYVEKRSAALALAAARRTPEALEALKAAQSLLTEPSFHSEHAALVEDLKAADSVEDAVAKSLLALPVGAALDVERRVAAGWVRVAGKISKRWTKGVDVDTEQGRIFLLPDDLRLSSVWTTLKRPGGLTDRALAVRALLDRDAEGAGKIMIEAPRGALAAHPTTALSEPEAVEKDARARLEEALEDPRPAVLSALLAERGNTRTIRDARDRVDAQLAEARETLFGFRELVTSGGWSPVRVPKRKGVFGWTAAGEAAAGVPCVLDLEFFALPNTTYRAWIYVGGCCKLAFDWRVQDGAAEPAPLKHNLTFLTSGHGRMTHEASSREPVRWEWIPVPLGDAAGPRKLRLIAQQPGASLAFACISSTREAPPKVDELAKRAEAEADRDVDAPFLDFTQEPRGWAARGNATSGHRFGWRRSAESAGKPGEIGGSFCRGPMAYFADVALAAPLGLSDELSASGRFDVPRRDKADCEIELGWFSRAQADAGQYTAFVGLSMSEPHKGGGFRFTPLIRFSGDKSGTIGTGDIFELPLDGNYRFTMTWKPDRKGGGTLEVQVSGKVEAVRRAVLPPGKAPAGPLLDAFGFFTPDMSQKSPASWIEVYADELHYTGRAR